MSPSLHASVPLHTPTFLPRNTILSLYNPVNLIGFQDPAQSTSSLFLVILDILSLVLFQLFFFQLFLSDYYVASNTVLYLIYFRFLLSSYPYLPEHDV